MKKEINLGQLLAVAVTLLIAIVTGWVTINNKVAAHEIEIQNIKDRQQKTETVLDRIESKIDEINKGQTDILVKLENKQNKK